MVIVSNKCNSLHKHLIQVYFCQIPDYEKSLYKITFEILILLSLLIIKIRCDSCSFLENTCSRTVQNIHLKEWDGVTGHYKTRTRCVSGRAGHLVAEVWTLHHAIAHLSQRDTRAILAAPELVWVPLWVTSHSVLAVCLILPTFTVLDPVTHPRVLDTRSCQHSWYRSD